MDSTFSNYEVQLHVTWIADRISASKKIGLAKKLESILRIEEFET